MHWSVDVDATTLRDYQPHKVLCPKVVGLPDRCMRTRSRSCFVSCESLIILWGGCGALVRMPTRSHLAPPGSDSPGGICISAGYFSRKSTTLHAARAGTASSPEWRLATFGQHSWHAPVTSASLQPIDTGKRLIGIPSGKDAGLPRLTHCAAIGASSMANLCD